MKWVSFRWGGGEKWRERESGWMSVCRAHKIIMIIMSMLKGYTPNWADKMDFHFMFAYAKHRCHDAINICNFIYCRKETRDTRTRSLHCTTQICLLWLVVRLMLLQPLPVCMRSIRSCLVPFYAHTKKTAINSIQIQLNGMDAHQCFIHSSQLAINDRYSMGKYICVGTIVEVPSSNRAPRKLWIQFQMRKITSTSILCETKKRRHNMLCLHAARHRWRQSHDCI